MLDFFAGYLQQTVYRRKTRFVNNIISTGSLFSGPDDQKSNLKHNEHFLNNFHSGKKKCRESQSANTTVVDENRTVKLYPWDEEMGQCPNDVSELKYICGRLIMFLHDYNLY